MLLFYNKLFWFFFLFLRAKHSVKHHRVNASVDTLDNRQIVDQNV